MARLISVVGAAECSAEEAKAAEEVGRLLAKAGFGVVCGGLGGVMQATCNGCRQAGGTTVGILPGNDPNDANPWVEIPIPTGMGEARNVLVAKAGEAMVAVGGEYGTLSEIAFALKLGKTVVAIGKWSELEGVMPANSAPDAADLVIKALNAS